ncbi:MAG: DUF4926 domain-containing protein [Methylococcaceae bacterium]|nr:DUF4926 domain-containing protein [Methylococcaceae bacterium]
MLKIGDLVELITDIPDKNLRAGMLGAVVHCHDASFYEVEFSHEDGETLACLALSVKQFVLAWRSEDKQWISSGERVAALMRSLPDEAAQEVFDFACFLSVKNQSPRGLIKQERYRL